MGAWQQNVEINTDTVTSYWAVFSCVTLIAGDIAKLQPWVMQKQPSGVWKKTIQRPVLQRPNRFQTRAEFYGYWVMSKLLAGNAYIYKERDANGFVIALYVLDPRLVTPLIAPDGEVYYRLGIDNLAGIDEVSGQTVVPASEIIHDKMYTIFHPLVGVSPIYACGIAAMQGAAIQKNSFRFFDNMSRPSGILVAPSAISEETAKELKNNWEANFGAGKVGKVAVLGDGLKYEQMTIDAVDAQLIEQLKMTAEMVAACFHVPPYKIGVGAMPTVNNTAQLNQQYYDQCLHHIIETMEERLDIGLELPNDGVANFEVWFDLAGLLRMDPNARYESHSKAVNGGWKAPNESRLEENMEPMAGGDTPYLQQQNYSLAALAARDKAAIDGDGTDVQSTALNGAQVASLEAILLSAATGAIPKESAKAALAASFPDLSSDEIDAMIDPIEVKAPITPPATPAIAPPAAPAEPAPPRGMTAEDAHELAGLFAKALNA